VRIVLLVDIDSLIEGGYLLMEVVMVFENLEVAQGWMHIVPTQIRGSSMIGRGWKRRRWIYGQSSGENRKIEGQMRNIRGKPMWRGLSSEAGSGDAKLQRVPLL
jgi:hypothetical protein